MRLEEDEDDDDDKKDRRTKKSRNNSSEKLYNGDLLPDVRCAYCGAERLAALFSMTNIIDILLIGKSTLPLLRHFLTCGY